MKFTYCRDCDDAFKKTTFEGARCIYCRKKNTIEITIHDFSYYMGYALLLIGAASFIILEGNSMQLPVIMFSLAIGMILSVQARIKVKKKAIDEGRQL